MYDKESSTRQANKTKQMAEPEKSGWRLRKGERRGKGKEKKGKVGKVHPRFVSIVLAECPEDAEERV